MPGSKRKNNASGRPKQKRKKTTQFTSQQLEAVEQRKKIQKDLDKAQRDAYKANEEHNRKIRAANRSYDEKKKKAKLQHDKAIKAANAKATKLEIDQAIENAGATYRKAIGAAEAERSKAHKDIHDESDAYVKTLKIKEMQQKLERIGKEANVANCSHCDKPCVTGGVEKGGSYLCPKCTGLAYCDTCDEWRNKEEILECHDCEGTFCQLGSGKVWRRHL